ncbi:CoA transferase [Streptomyces sp. NBC_00654]|uniref:CaiB/BaiF CoA transferase family protein n=1 Tax=Streptomyces sp. NBC_00654 TaxID=2975799 RepID=UPI0022570731|nr:CaiB/BaiF CoA-transferase family protein [Streptomyces sp. NBC_00654]MCX4970535.1 CoA transferase [Streptomyces sp. NBC_00654]
MSAFGGHSPAGAQAEAGSKPLSGLRVLELTGIGPAPFACMLLADLGAEVIRVDRADGDRPFAEWHRVLDRGRRSVALDLKNPHAVRATLRLAEQCDVLVEGFRPGVAERLGIGPHQCHARNPSLVYARMTGWGQHGPLAQTPGHDINYIALTGVLDAIGPAGGPPVPPVNLLGDFAGGGMLLFGGILAAVLEQRRTGRGRVVDAAIVDGTALLMSMLLGMSGTGQWQSARGGNLLDGGAPFYCVYPCHDGRYVAVGAIEDRFFTALVRGLGLDPGRLPDRWRRANWDALRTVFAERFARRTRDEWASAFADTDACVTPVLSVEEAARHPHLRARGSFLPDGSALQPASAPRYDGGEPPRPAPPPIPGQHTREVLAESGWSEEEIERLLSSGAARAGTEPADGVRRGAPSRS